MLKRYFLSNLMVVIFLNLLVKPIWIFLIDRNVQLQVGHQAYGLYSALLSLSIIFSIVLDFGITNYNNRHVATDNTRLQFSLPNMIVAKAIFSIFYFVLIFILAFIFHYSGEAFYILLLLGLVQLLNSFLQFLRSNVSANHDFKLDSLLSILDKLVMIVVCGYLLLSPSTKLLFNIHWYLYAQIGAYLIAIIVAIIVIIHRYAKIDFSNFSFTEMKTFCISSLPYALLILLMGIYMRSDSLLLERIDGPAASSLYAEAYRILDALNMIGFLLAGILLPMFTRLISKKLKVDEIVSTSTNIIFSVSLCILAHSLVYRIDIMHFLDKNAAYELPFVYMLVIASFPAYCIMYIYSTLLTANGDIFLLIKMAIVGCLISISLNLFLIPQLQALGASISACIVQWTMAAISLYYCIRKFNLKVDVIRILKFILLFAILLIFNFGLQYFSVSMLLAIAANIPIYIIYVYASHLWDRQTIMQYLSQYKSTD